MVAQLTSHRIFMLAITGILSLIIACSGPDTGDDSDPTATPMPTPTPTPTATLTPTTESTEPAEPANAATEAPESTPSPEPTATVVPSPTATHIPVGMVDSLPRAEEFPSGNFALANQGSRTAVDLANAYQDSGSHLERLNTWGFKEHVFREFTHQRPGPEDPSPSYFLATVNAYGSPEQADMFFEWWTEFSHTQGHSEVEPPDIGDYAYATTVPTAEGKPTAFLFVRRGARIYAYYAEEGKPVEMVNQVATIVFERINTAPS